MTARPGHQQSSLNSGEIGAELFNRIDLKQWYQAAKRMKNAEPVPQGGFKLLPGTRLRGRARRVPEAVAGTPASAPGPHEVAASVATLTFSGATSVAMVEISAFVADVAAGATLRVQYQDTESAWHDFAPAFALATTERTRLAARPPNAPVSALAIRAWVAGMSEAVEVMVGALNAWRETATLSPCEMLPFTFSDDQAYLFVVIPGFVDVWRNGVHVGASRCPVTAQTLRSFKAAQQFDTLFLFHKTIESARIMRRGAHHEWQYDLLPYESIPEVDYGGEYSKTTDTWDVFIRWSEDTKPDLYLSLSVDDEETPAVVLASASTDYAAFASAVEAAIEALPSIEGGITVTQETATKLLHLTIEFGGGNDGNPFTLAAQIVNTSEASALATHVVIGETEGEAVISETQGWPATGVMFQDRLVPAGFAAKPSGLMASRNGEYFDFNIEATAAAAAILVNLGTDAAETINHLAVARHLIVFTNAAEYFLSDRVLQRTEPPNFVKNSEYGAHPDSPIVSLDGEIYYVGKEGALIFYAFYDDVSTHYETAPASLLASHLMEGLRDLAVQRASLGSDASRLFALRADGRLIVGAIIRGQDVLAFCEWASDNATTETMCVTGDNKAHLAVRREVDGAEAILIEEMEEDQLFHAAIVQEFMAPQTTIAGLEEHEGEEVWAEADGTVVGPFTVEGGEIELPEAAEVVAVGRWTPFEVESLPQIRVLKDNIVLLRPGRIHSVRASVVDTTSIAIGANGRRPRDVGLYRAGMEVDGPPPPVTRWVAAEGIPGFVEEGPTAVFTQVRPGRCRVTGWVLERS